MVEQRPAVHMTYAIDSCVPSYVAPPCSELRLVGKGSIIAGLFPELHPQLLALGEITDLAQANAQLAADLGNIIFMNQIERR